MEEKSFLSRGFSNCTKTIPTKILDFKIVNATQLISTDVLNKIVDSVTKAVRIVVKKFYVVNDVPIVEASVELEDVTAAIAVRSFLDGANIYDDCCTLQIDFASPDVRRLAVDCNDDRTWDFTRSSDPRPWCESHSSDPSRSHPDSKRLGSNVDSDDLQTSTPKKIRIHSPDRYQSSREGRHHKEFPESPNNNSGFLSSEGRSSRPGHESPHSIKSRFSNTEVLNHMAGNESPSDKFEFSSLEDKSRASRQSPDRFKSRLINSEDPTYKAGNETLNNKFVLPISGCGHNKFNNFDFRAQKYRQSSEESDSRNSDKIKSEIIPFGNPVSPSHRATLEATHTPISDVTFNFEDFQSNSNFEGSPADSWSNRNVTSEGSSFFPQLEKNVNEFGRVLIVYNFPEVVDPFKVFNLFCVYGDVIRVKFLLKQQGSALVEMSDCEAAWRVIDNLNRINIAGQKICIKMSNQAEIFPGVNLLHRTMPNGKPMFQDFSRCQHHRFSSTFEASKNRIVQPSPVLHFFNLTKEINTVPLLYDVLCNGCRAPMPVAAKFTLASALRPTNSGHMEFASIEDSVEALIKANNFRVNVPGGSCALLKLCFAVSRPDQKMKPTSSLLNFDDAISQ